MNAERVLQELITADRQLRSVEDGIFSVLPEASTEHHYDRRAVFYDLVIGTRIYNRIMWGGSPRDYIAFVREAVGSNPATPMLDARCGSMLFTAEAYLESDRRVIASDQSLGMLRRARQRLRKLCQFVSLVSDAFPLTSLRFETVIPAGGTGWMRFWTVNDVGILGSKINFNPNVATSENAYNQGSNLHKLKLSTTSTITIPVFAPGC